ncbi:MAG: radical SAM protein [Nitrospinae bacterium]|nr:radical SAM protein [Nitrospinota bacterium]
MNSLNVSEIFVSIQGESSQIGRPCVFVRLAGCNIRCAYCDSEYAARGKGEPMTMGQIVEQVKAFGVDLVEVTGGEPLIQPGCVALVKKLAAEGFEVMVETNGTVDIGEVNTVASCVVDIKTPGSKSEGTFNEVNFKRLTTADEVKFVVTSRDDFNWAVAICRERRLCNQTAVLFSAAWGMVEMEDLAMWLIESKLAARLNPQLHKIIWGKDRRGV